jgi:hypothetical protein
VAKDQRDDEWAAGLVRRVGLAVKEARGGKSAAWLSEQTAKLGYRISPTVIAKLDSGHRGDVLSVAELLILAAALGVPPLVLLYPDLPDGTVEIIPIMSGSSFDAYMWATGMAPSFSNPGAGPSNGEELIDAVRERYDLMVQLAKLHVQSGSSSDDLIRKSLESQIPPISKRIKNLNTLIREYGGVLEDG